MADLFGYLGWADDDEGVEQLVQQEDFHSLGRLYPELVLVGVIAELVQQTRSQLIQLQLGVRAQDHDHMGGGLHRYLVQLKLAQLVQLQLDVQAHLDGGGQRCHTVVPSRQWKWQLSQLWFWQDPLWCGGGDQRVLVDSGVDVEA
jgi:hypothetical protein